MEIESLVCTYITLPCNGVFNKCFKVDCGGHCAILWT